MPDSYRSLVREAIQAMTGMTNPQGRHYTPGEAGFDGSMDLIFLLCDGSPAGAMSCEVKEDDAQLFYCHVRSGYRACEGRFFGLAVDHFRSAGMQVVRTNFQWPHPGQCIDNALALGFRRIERIEMVRESDRNYQERPLPDGVSLSTWSDDCLDDAARLLSENGNEIDRVIYPQEQTFAGARAQLKKITGNMYGNFQASHSLIARAGDRMIGMLLVTDFPGDSLLIPEITLHRDYRGMGIASAMMGRVIRSTPELSDNKLRLVVNGHNADAIRLYERKGFRPLFAFRQYVLNVSHQPADATSSRSS